MPVTELIPLSISDPLVGGHLEIYCDDCERAARSWKAAASCRATKIMRIDHKMGYATLGQFLGVLHRTAPIHLGSRVTLVLNQRSVAKPYVDDNRMFYLAADNDQDREWVDELAARRLDQSAAGLSPLSEEASDAGAVRRSLRRPRRGRHGDRPALAFAAGAVALWSTNALVARYLLASHPLSLVQFLQFAGPRWSFLADPAPLSSAAAAGGDARRAPCRRPSASSAWSAPWCCNIWPSRSMPVVEANLIAYTWPLMVAAAIIAAAARGARRCWRQPRHRALSAWRW